MQQTVKLQLLFDPARVTLHVENKLLDKIRSETHCVLPSKTSCFLFGNCRPIYLFTSRWHRRYRLSYLWKL